MLTIICGEDIVASRRLLQQLKQNYKQRGYVIEQITTSQIIEIQKSNEGVVDLFGQEAVYFVENLSSQYKGRGKSEFKTAVDEFSKHKTMHLVDWENGKSAYGLATLKKLTHDFHEQKPLKNIFQLLDDCVPGNLKQFHATFHTVLETQDAMFVYTLLWRHIRKLVLANEGVLDPKTPPWQRGKIQGQARQWKSEKLINFYEGLARIDSGMKTASSTFSITESIDLLACYYLK